MTHYFHDVNNAIKALHYRHGIGDIKEIMRFADGRIELTAQGFGMKPHTRKGRIVIGKRAHTHTVKMYGHQMTVMIV